MVPTGTQDEEEVRKQHFCGESGNNCDDEDVNESEVTCGNDCFVEAGNDAVGKVAAMVVVKVVQVAMTETKVDVNLVVADEQNSCSCC